MLKIAFLESQEDRSAVTCKVSTLCSLAQLEALRQVAAPIGEHLVLARELVRVAVGRVALMRPNLLRVCGNVD